MFTIMFRMNSEEGERYYCGYGYVNSSLYNTTRKMVRALDIGI